MEEDLKALVGEPKQSEAESIGLDIGAIMERIDRRFDALEELLKKDVSIDESNNDKVSITEAEGKIDEKEEYREAAEEREDN